MSISRRDFIKGAAVAAGGAVIAGCAPKMVSTEEAPAAAGAESGYNWLTAPAPIAAADIKETIAHILNYCSSVFCFLGKLFRF